MSRPGSRLLMNRLWRILPGRLTVLPGTLPAILPEALPVTPLEALLAKILPGLTRFRLRTGSPTLMMRPMCPGLPFRERMTLPLRPAMWRRGSARSSLLPNSSMPVSVPSTSVLRWMTIPHWAISITVFSTLACQCPGRCRSSIPSWPPTRGSS